MRLKLFITLSFLFIGNTLFAQDLDSYKYIIVPRKYDFLKSADKYQLNSLTKFLFNKKGMVALFEDEEKPDDLFNNSCLGLETKVSENSKLLTTNLTIELIDCTNTVVYTSAEGKSRIKDFKKAYHDALRKAFQSIQTLDYSFDKSLVSTIKKEPIAATKEVVVDETPVSVNEEVAKAENKVKTEVEKIQDTVRVERDLDTELAKTDLYVLYAQRIENGFQLVDNTPKVVYKLLKTTHKDIYTLDGHTGIAYAKGDKWFVEYYFDGKLVTKELNIKF
ncbi:MAG: hypothetical protein QNJ57_02880 [Flavobacteriaceae bacterium]|nr:hypothetical protein [Flavobacteriaceae bacterium]